MCLEKGEKESRLDPKTEEDIGIAIYSYNHGSGFCFLYVNGSSNYIYTENLELELTNLKIEGLADGESKLEIKLNPGEEKFIKLTKISMDEGTSYGSSCSYGF